MTPRVLVKAGVSFDRIAPAGARILEAIKATAKALGHDIMITCGTEAHSEDDPHFEGAAYDFRTHSWTEDQKKTALRELMLQLQRGAIDAPVEVSGGLATTHFFAWIEHPGATNEHGHVQRRRGVEFTMRDYLDA